MALETALKALASTAPATLAQRMQAVNDLNAEISKLETELGEPHGRPVLNAERAKARLEKLQAQRAAKNPAPGAAAMPIVSHAPAKPPREFKSSGSAMIDAAVRASGSWCLDQHMLKMRRDELAAIVARFAPQSLDGQAAAANLSKVETALKRYE